MAFNEIWDNTSPLDTQAANQLGADLRNLRIDVMQRLSQFSAGTLALRPVPDPASGGFAWGSANQGVTYFATDTGQMFYWSGAAWVDISVLLGIGPKVITLQGPQPAVGGNATDLTIYTATLRAGTLPPTPVRSLFVYWAAVRTGGAGAFTIRLKLNGVSFAGYPSGTNNFLSGYSILYNTAVAVQAGYNFPAAGEVTVSQQGPIIPPNANTAADNDLTVTMNAPGGTTVLPNFFAMFLI